MKTEITSSSLQELINKKAEAKAREEIAVLCKAINNSGLLDLDDFKIVNDSYITNMRSSLWGLDLCKTESPLYKLYQVKLKKHIESETKDFVNKVNQLVEQSNTLLNI